MSEPNIPADVSDAELAEALKLVRSRRQHQDEETIFVRGEGGSVFEMTPSRMSADMKRRMQMGRLRRVHPDGTPHQTAATGSATAGGSALTEGRVPRPVKSAPKKDWVLYAVAVLGLDEEQALEMTRQELIELPEDHAEHTSPPEPGDAPAAGGRPGESAAKPEWIGYVVKQGLLSREDAEAYTKADLIAMVS